MLVFRVVRIYVRMYLQYLHPVHMYSVPTLVVRYEYIHMYVYVPYECLLRCEAVNPLNSLIQRFSLLPFSVLKNKSDRYGISHCKNFC